MGLFSIGSKVGPRYDPHRPWVLVTFKGDGRVKMTDYFASQSAAAAALRERAARDDSQRDRWVYKIRHVTGSFSLWNATTEPLHPHEYNRIARIQWGLAMRARGYAARTRTRRSRGAR